VDTSKKWVVAQAPLRELPNAKSRKLLDLPLGALVSLTGRTEPGVTSGVLHEWVEVIYLAAAQRHIGWVYDGYLEPYTEEFPPHVVSIQSPTINPNDAAQYMVWRGKTQYNLCGELCVCYIAGDDIEAMLSKWEAKAISFYQRVFGSGMARGTNTAELDSMLSSYGYPTPSTRLDTGLRDPLLGRPVVTPGRMAEMLSTHRAIVGVKISKSTGDLRTSGILHWVVIEDVTPDGINRGWVELYNPFPNRMQRYSWTEFVASMGAPYGIWVRR
jgi:hypothetical protein